MSVLDELEAARARMVAEDAKKRRISRPRKVPRGIRFRRRIPLERECWMCGAMWACEHREPELLALGGASK